jgi:hypothetical protein
MRIPLLSATGVYLYNNCAFEVYSFTTICPQVGVPSNGTVHTSNGINNSTWYWEPYQYPIQGGVSIKLSKSSNGSDPITQLEYTIANDTIWYDLSNVNCGPTSQTSTEDCPFKDTGMFLTTYPTDCPTSICEAGNGICTAYNVPDDDWAVRQCDYDHSLVMYMCSPVAVTVVP